jgi:hypothetical protein
MRVVEGDRVRGAAGTAGGSCGTFTYNVPRTQSYDGRGKLKNQIWVETVFEKFPTEISCRGARIRLVLSSASPFQHLGCSRKQL